VNKFMENEKEAAEVGGSFKDKLLKKKYPNPKEVKDKLIY
jgi:hypothetical protein